MLKQWICEYKTKRLLKKREPVHSCDFGKSRKIAVLCSEKFEDEAQRVALKEALEGMGKEVSLMVFCPEPKKKTTQQKAYDRKAISMWGDVHHEDLTYFLHQQYDFALCLDQSGHFLVQYVFSMIKTRCRVGLIPDGPNELFELVVRGTDTSARLSDEVLKYLKMIKSDE